MHWQPPIIVWQPCAAAILRNKAPLHWIWFLDSWILLTLSVLSKPFKLILLRSCALSYHPATYGNPVILWLPALRSRPAHTQPLPLQWHWAIPAIVSPHLSRNCVTPEHYCYVIHLGEPVLITIIVAGYNPKSRIASINLVAFRLLLFSHWNFI